MLSKGLAVAVILLFVGVGIQPAFAVETKSIAVENVEDWGCKEISDKKILKVESLLDRIDIISKLLLLLSRNNPDLINENKKSSNKIKELSSTFKELATKPSEENRPICNILERLGVIFIFSYCFYAIICAGILYDVPEGKLLHKILSFILFIPAIPIMLLLKSWMFLYFDAFDCI